MKKALWSGLAYLGVSFFLSGLQGSLYFFPIPLPAIWFIVLTFYSFRKSLWFSLWLNIPHLLVIASFSVASWAPMILQMNAMTLAFYFIRERFHTQKLHIALGASGGFVIFQALTWLRESLWSAWSWPPLLSWVGTGLCTLLVAPFIIFALDSVTQRIDYERIDTLENLRI